MVFVIQSKCLLVITKLETVRYHLVHYITESYAYLRYVLYSHFEVYSIGINTADNHLVVVYYLSYKLCRV